MVRLYRDSRPVRLGSASLRDPLITPSNRESSRCSIAEAVGRLKWAGTCGLGGGGATLRRPIQGVIFVKLREFLEGDHSPLRYHLGATPGRTFDRRRGKPIEQNCSSTVRCFLNFVPGGCWSDRRKSHFPHELHFDRRKRKRDSRTKLNHSATRHARSELVFLSETKIACREMRNIAFHFDRLRAMRQSGWKSPQSSWRARRGRQREHESALIITNLINNWRRTVEIRVSQFVFGQGVERQDGCMIVCIVVGWRFQAQSLATWASRA